MTSFLTVSVFVCVHTSACIISSEADPQDDMHKLLQYLPDKTYI